MPRDVQNKNSKKEQTRRSKRLEELNKKKKLNKESDSDDNNESGSDSEDIDIHEYRKYLGKIFPSKHLEKKIKDGENLKKALKKIKTDENEKSKKQSNTKKNNKSKKQLSESEEEVWETASDTEEEDKPVIKKNTKNTKNTKNKKQKNKSISETEDSSSYEEDDDDDDDDDEDDENEIKLKSAKKLNIIFSFAGDGEEEDEWLSEDDYDSDYEDYEDTDDVTEDEDETVSTENTEDTEDSEDSAEDNKNKKAKNKKQLKNKSTDKKEKTNEKTDKTNIETTAETNNILTKLKEISNSNPADKAMQKCIELYQEDLKNQEAKKEKKEKKHKAKNLRIFRKIVRDKNTMNDFAFYEKLEIEEQKKIIKELKEINKIIRVEKPYRLSLLESNIPVQFKASAIKKINSLRYMEPGSGEFYKIKNWVDTFMRIPFGKNIGLPISIADGVDKCHEFMENAQNTLNSAVYGLNDAKMQIMQMLGQLLTNPQAIGTAIAIHGPPGTGKTSLVKEGISKILNRPFAFIALGGATDSSFLEGHGYTYEGSSWGKIIQILIDSQCMNPVIYFDELDKISDTPRGEEIAGILTHLTDTSQNSQFHDKYFAEINFDLSKCLFIFSYNDETKVNPILKDRMYRIKTVGYSGKEKICISNNYLLPKVREQVKFANEDITIKDDVISYIVDKYCDKEDGVRNLKRCLEIIYTKLNLYRLMKPGSNIFEKDMALKVEFPLTVTNCIVDKLIKNENKLSQALYSMYI
jgi:ATP-dependent Lon protease